MSGFARALWFLPCIICFAVAGAGMILGREGWGWFLFGGLLALPPVARAASGRRDAGRFARREMP